MRDHHLTGPFLGKGTKETNPVLGNRRLYDEEAAVVERAWTSRGMRGFVRPIHSSGKVPSIPTTSTVMHDPIRPNASALSWPARSGMIKRILGADPMPPPTPQDPPRSPSSGGGRHVFIDAARSVAILGAMTAHALNTFGVWAAVSPGIVKGLSNLLFYACTPTFFLLFGVMLEWVYVVRRERVGASTVVRQMSQRAGMCWLGLVLGIGCAYLGGRLAADQLPPALLNLIDTPNSGILRFYAAALLLCIPVVIARPMIGPRLPLILVAVIWVGAAALPLLPWPGMESRWGFLCGFLVAHPPAWSSGSLWHNLSIVFLGMALGIHMRSRMRLGLSPLGGRPVQALASFCLAGIVVCAVIYGPLTLAESYLGTGRTLRSAAHPAYFLISTLSALILIWVAQKCFPIGTTVRPSARWLLALGRHSLLVFAVGNAALNLHPREPVPQLWSGRLLVLLYLAAVCLLAQLADLRMRRRLSSQ